MMCKVFKVRKSSYYRWLKEGHSQSWQENEKILVEVMDIFEESKESYGSPGMTQELKARGMVIGQNKVAAMMRAAYRRAKRKKKFKGTTDSKHNYPVAPNLLNQDFFSYQTR
jgi:transposase InsO family protein